MKKPTNGFDKLSIAEFNNQLGVVVESMTGNANFPNLQTAVQALATAAANFDELVKKAANRDRIAIIGRDTERSSITKTLHDLSVDVHAVAKGNEAILASSGFPYTQERKPTPDMEQPAPPRLSQGVNNGEIDCRTYAQPGMKSVNFYSTTDPAAATLDADVNWSVTSSNKVKHTFVNLISGQRYFIKVGLVGVRGQEVISNPVPYIPQ